MRNKTFYHIKYRLSAILWIFLSTLSAVSAADVATLNVGCFNIRFKTSADQGELSWDNRKSYVARTITDFGYDIVGVNEMNAGSQQEDMKRLLTEYSFVEWGGNSSTVPNQGTINAVLFRTDKFDLLEEGHYFLSTDPSKSLLSWDNSNGNKRFTVWAKLRVKATGEQLYYFITHLDHQGSDARNEGTRINIEKVRSISGHYPAIICGDHNSSAIRYPFYDLCSAYLSDSRKVSETPFPWPKDGTLCKWDPEKKDGTRLDYVWVKGMKVHTYRHINETFGRGVTPSDHFPVIASVSLEPFTEKTHTRYVDINAAEGGDGSKSAPFRHIQEAVDATCNGDTIYVAQGQYTVTGTELSDGRNATLDISHSLDIFGGYDSAFEEVTGCTVLSGDISGNDEIVDGVWTGREENAYRVVTVQKYCALTLRNFEIVGGNADGSATTGAGIACLGSRLILDKVIIRDNRSTGQGAGIYAAGQLLCTDCRFIRNVSSANGGAYFTAYAGVELWWRHAMTGCYFSGNEAVQGSAGYHSGYSWAYLGHNTYAGNKATYGGTVSLNGTAYASRTTLVNNTFVNNRIEAVGGVINETKGGSAVYANLNAASTVSIINNTIVGNHASCYKNGVPTTDFCGAAVHIYNGTPFIFNNVIAGNRSTSATGDVYNAGQPATTGYNLFSSTDNINITPSPTDISGTSVDASVLLLGNMLESNIVEGEIVPVLALNGGPVETVKVKRRFFGTHAIDVLPASQFDEKLLNGDVDNTIELRNKLIFDQRGVARSTDGTSSIGAYEYGKGGTGVTETTAAADSPVRTYQNGPTLYLSASTTLQDARIFSPAGSAVIHLGEVSAGKTPVDISRLYPGVYILSWKGGASRFIKR